MKNNNRKPKKKRLLPGLKRVKVNSGQDAVIRWIKIAVIVIGALAVLVIAGNRFGNFTVASISDYFNGLMSGIKKGDGYPYYFDSSSVKDIKKIDSDLLVIGDDGFYVLDSTARKLNNTRHAYSEPVCDTVNGRAIIFDIGSCSYQIVSKTSVMYEGSTSQKILTACIGKDGIYAIATRGESSVSQLTVYNKRNAEIFKWNCSKENIVSVDISDNCKRAVVSVIGAENGELYSKVHVFDFEYKEPLTDINFGSQIVAKVEYINRNRIVCSGERTLTFLNRKFERTDIDLSLNNLSRIYTGENNLTAVVLSKYGSSSSKIINVYNKNGKQLFTKELDFAVRSVSCDGDYISVLSDKKLVSFSRHGREVGNTEITSDGIYCFIDGNIIYVMTTNGINAHKTFGTHGLELVTRTAQVNNE